MSGLTDLTVQKKRLVNMKIHLQKLPKIKNKKTEKYEQFISKLWDNFKWPNIHIITGPKRKGKWKRKIFKIMAEYLPNMIQEV